MGRQNVFIIRMHLKDALRQHSIISKKIECLNGDVQSVYDGRIRSRILMSLACEIQAERRLRSDIKLLRDSLMSLYA